MERESIFSRIKHAWNVFLNRGTSSNFTYYGPSSSLRPDRAILTRGREKTIVTSVFNRIALDAASIDIRHVRLDDNNCYVETIESTLNSRLNLEANIDQTGRAFKQDIVFSMLDEGCVAVVPVDTDTDPDQTGSYQINSIRVGQIVEWYPRHIKVRLYNEFTGQREDVVVSKQSVAIIENPLYSVINEPNSTMQRLIRKLSLLDAVDEQSSSGKLDLIIQLPYVIKTEARRAQAEQRRGEIEKQLAGSKYGIAYTDGTERITQLNRPIENNLMSQVEYLTSMLYSQLGITQAVLDGSADDKTMLNYYNRTIEPILSAIVDEFNRKFLTKTARSQKQSFEFFRDPFRLVPVNDLAEIADKMTRNEIMTSNEIRQIIGMKPSQDPNADQLRNKNLNPMAPEELEPSASEESDPDQMSEDDISQSLSDSEDLDSQIDELENLLNHGDTFFDESVDDFLQHYASKYYDPVKAHEYYMRTRELKGRTSTAGLNESGREAASYIRKQLNAERDSKIQSDKSKSESTISGLKSAKKSETDRIKSEAQAEVERLKAKKQEAFDSATNNLKHVLDQISQSKQKDYKQASEHLSRIIENLNADKKSKVESAKNSMQSMIDSLNASLKSMSKEARAAKREEIKAQISKLRDDNKKFRDKLTEDTKSSIASERADTRSKKESITKTASDATKTQRELTSKTKEAVSSRTKSDIANTRASAKDAKSKVAEKTKNDVSSERERHRNVKIKLNSEYMQRYVDELNKLKSDNSFKAKSKKSKK